MFVANSLHTHIANSFAPLYMLPVRFVAPHVPWATSAQCSDAFHSLFRSAVFAFPCWPGANSHNIIHEERMHAHAHKCWHMCERTVCGRTASARTSSCRSDVRTFRLAQVDNQPSTCYGAMHSHDYENVCLCVQGVLRWPRRRLRFHNSHANDDGGNGCGPKVSSESCGQCTDPDIPVLSTPIGMHAFHRCSAYRSSKMCSQSYDELARILGSR